MHTIHPDYAWDTERFVITNAKNAPQIYMERVVRGLFPNQEITTNVRATLRVQGDRKAPLEIDVYLPKLKLGFEYQVYTLRFSSFYIFIFILCFVLFCFYNYLYCFWFILIFNILILFRIPITIFIPTLALLLSRNIQTKKSQKKQTNK